MGLLVLYPENKSQESLRYTHESGMTFKATSLRKNVCIIRLLHKKCPCPFSTLSRETNGQIQVSSHGFHSVTTLWGSRGLRLLQRARTPASRHQKHSEYKSDTQGIHALSWIEWGLGFTLHHLPLLPNASLWKSLGVPACSTCACSLPFSSQL